jgi:hypothetical protein
MEIINKRQQKIIKNREIEIDTNTKNVIKEWYDFSTSRFNINANSFVFGNDRPISTTTMTNKKIFTLKKLVLMNHS